MSNKKMHIGLLLLLIIAGGCHTKQAGRQQRLKKAAWLLGAWQQPGAEGMLSEIWQRESDTIYVGTGLLVNANGDTLFSEKLRLADRHDTLWYLPTVSNQNRGKEVPFKEIALNDTEMIFENPLHDFPQRIVYRRINTDSIQASIEGVQDGKPRKEVFSFRRK